MSAMQKLCVSGSQFSDVFRPLAHLAEFQLQQFICSGDFCLSANLEGEIMFI